MMPENIGQHIRQARKAKGITQDRLASLMYVSRQTVSSWENARTQPDYETLQKLAALLDINLAQVFGTAEAKDDSASETDAEAEDPDSASSEDDTAKADSESSVSAAPDPISACGSQNADPPAAIRVVVQPAKPQRKWYAVIAALCAAALVLLIGVHGRFASKAPHYTPEQFIQAQTPVPGQAHVTMYTKENSLRVSHPSSDTYPSWNYNLYLREDNGIGFQIERLRLVHFLENGATAIRDRSASEIAEHKQTSHLNGYALMMLAMGYIPTEKNPAFPVGIGVLLEGHDDGGNRLSFMQYIALPQFP